MRRRVPEQVPEQVDLVPTQDARIPDVPAVACRVSPDVAADLLAHHPPAFVVRPPDPPPAEETQT